MEDQRLVGGSRSQGKWQRIQILIAPSAKPWMLHSSFHPQASSAGDGKDSTWAGRRQGHLFLLGPCTAPLAYPRAWIAGCHPSPPPPTHTHLPQGQEVPHSFLLRPLKPSKEAGPSSLLGRTERLRNHPGTHSTVW